MTISELIYYKCVRDERRPKTSAVVMAVNEASEMFPRNCRDDVITNLIMIKPHEIATHMVNGIAMAAPVTSLILI